MANQDIQIALDLGSRSIKAAAFDNKENIVHKIYHPMKGPLHECLKNMLESLQSDLNNKHCFLCAITGANSDYFADLFGLKSINGILSTYLGIKKLVPRAGAILEIAGEHAKFIRLNLTGEDEVILKDFFVNSACSAGTGAFLEQEAHRLNLSIDDFGRLAAKSTRAVQIAGRCAVFAKTDIVHLHQNGVPLVDISYSLCRAVAQNIATELILSHEYNRPLVFVGGVAANRGIQKALRSILKLDKSSLIIPAHYLYPGVIGSFLSSKKLGMYSEFSLSEAIERIEKAPHKHPKRSSILMPLMPPRSFLSCSSSASNKEHKKNHLSNVYIGIDIGSTSTNIVCISSSGDVHAKKTLSTQGQPVAAVFRGLALLKKSLGTFHPKAVGITGSGRKLVAELIGADITLNEITAHATGGLHFFPDVDTIFDIGGQDSKFIQIQNGTIRNFAMNKVCSAGTGSFLEEMSELLGLKIRDEFAQEAMRSKNPIDLGERCTVFMSTELLRKMQEGAKREDLAAGLCYSVGKNYISRVTEQKTIGKFISFQGGVASNPAIVSALENFLHKPLRVHNHHEIAGALGAALFASRKKIDHSRFRGFEDLNIQAIDTQSFECPECANSCSIHLTKDSSRKRFYSGGLCDRYEGKNLSLSQKKNDRIDLFTEREKLLYRWIRPPSSKNNNDIIGIPQALHFYDLLPFWSTLFNELGIDYCISEPTTKKTIHKGIANCPTNPCLPVKTAYGHCLELLENGVKKVFIPSVSNLSFQTNQERMTHMCPASQAWPFTARALFSEKLEFLTPTIRFSLPSYLRSDIIELGGTLGSSSPKTIKAFQRAMKAQNDFYDSSQKMGQRLFSDFQNDAIYAVLLSRPYTVCDPTVRFHLKKIFDELNIVAIPLDMASFEAKDSGELDGMYWYYGKRFLQTVDALADRPEIAFIHLSNFGCGADSFIIHFLRQRLKNRPFLELEIDAHNQFTGIGTRLEAFTLSLDKSRLKRTKKAISAEKKQSSIINRHKLLIPQMSDHAFAFQASFQAFGVDAEVLPLPDEESITYGKQSVAGGECLPCSFVIGDMLKYLKNHRDDSVPPAFFMISGDGPCRLGQYPYLQRLVLDGKGFSDALIFDASQDQAFYDRFGILPKPFKRRTWQGFVAVDLLFRKWRETRPYVIDKNQLDRFYKTQIQKICDQIQNNGNLSGQLKNSFIGMETFADPSIKQKPVIAVLGENYIRCNSVANGKIADLLEDLGSEVWFPSLYEWVYYGNWTARLHCLYEKKYKKYLDLFLIDTIQRWDENKITRRIRKSLRNLVEPSVRKNFRLASKYIPRTFEGETVIEVARTLDFYQRDVCGVIHVVPFGCMMGTIVDTLSERIIKDLYGFPVMTLYYDGLDCSSQISKLEGFMIRVRMWQEKRRKNEIFGTG